jgi:hypothetical protein
MQEALLALISVGVCSSSERALGYWFRRASSCRLLCFRRASVTAKDRVSRDLTTSALTARRQDCQSAAPPFMPLIRNPHRGELARA